MQDLSGQKLGQYELRERQGRGGMAEVYKAYQPGMDRFVAVKIMLGHLADDEGFITRFKREAQSVGKLRHPHIVNVFDFGVENNIYYMVMEYIEGGNLKHYIQQRRALPPLEALQLTSQMADALDYAHSRGMIHRDLKPANIMFMDKAHKHSVLTDFGIARLLGQAGLTASGAMVGTPAYISPEAARGEDVDERSDIYGLGIILYEMVTGKVPYDADTPLAIIMKHINAPLPTPRDYGRNVPPAVEKIIVKSLTKMPADRYQTAAEMKKAVDDVVNNWSQVVQTDEPVVPVEDDDDRTLIDAVGARTVQSTDVISSAVTPPPEQQKRHFSPVLAGIGIMALLIILAGIGFLLSSSDNEEKVENTQSALVIATSTGVETEVAVAPSETRATEIVTEEVQTATSTVTSTSVETEVAIVVATEVITEEVETATSTATSTDIPATELPTQTPTTPAPTETPTTPPTEIPTIEPTVEPVEVAAAETVHVSDVELVTLPRSQQLFPSPPGDFTAETHLSAAVEGDFQGAGLYVELEDNARIELLLAHCTANGDTCVGRGVYLDYLAGPEFDSLVVHDAVEFPDDEIFLRLTRTGITYTAEYRAGESDPWQTLQTFDVSQNALNVGFVAQSVSGGIPESNPNDLPPQNVIVYSFDLAPAIELASPGLNMLSSLTPLQDEVDSLFLAGNVDQAWELVNTRLTENPDDVEALVARALLHVENSDVEAALVDADHAIEIAPENPLGYIARADALRTWPAEDYEAAQNVLLTAQAFSPDNPEILWRLARAYVYAGDDTPESRAIFDRAVELGARGMRFNYFAGEYLYTSQREYETALPYLQTVHNSVLFNEFTLTYLAGTLIQLGRAEEAYEITKNFPWGAEYWWGFEDENDYAFLSFVAFKAGNYEEAREWAQKAIALSEQAYAAQHMMGLISWYADDDLETAMSYLDPLLQVDYSGNDFLHPAFGHTLQVDRARIFTAAGLYDEALAAYDAAIQSGDMESIAFEERADLYLVLNDRDSALNDLRRAFEVAGYIRGNQNERNRLKQRVVDLYWGEEAINVTNPPANYQLTEADLTIPILPGYGSDLDEFEDMLLHLPAEQVLEQINVRLESDPENIHLLAARGIARFVSDDIEGAKADADRIIELAPDDPLGYLIHVHITTHWSVEDPGGALENAQKAYDLAPTDPQAIWWLAWAYWNNGMFEEAADYFGRAEEAGARGFRYALAAGTFWYDQGQYERAIEPLKTFYIAQPYNLSFGRHLLGALIQTGQTDLALEIAYNLAPYADDEPDAYVHLAYTAYRAGNYEQAKAWAQVAIAFSEEEIYEARYLLALLKWYGEGDLAGAMDAFAALDGVYYEGFFINSRYGHDINLDRARIFTEAGDYQAAIDGYTTALTQDESNPYIYEARADVYLLIENVEAAQEDLRMAAELTTDEAERERLLDRILELES